MSNLIGSATTLSELEKLITERFYYGTKIHAEGEKGIRDSDGKPLEGVRIIKKGNRYRFERN